MTAGQLVGEPMLLHKVASRKNVREKVAEIFGWSGWPLTRWTDTHISSAAGSASVSP